MKMKIERMELDEAGGDPAKIAAGVLAQIPELALPVPIEEIAHGADIREIKRLDLTGYEGGLISWDDKFEGTILVNQRSMKERQRFTIGHELGHFLNPWHEPPGDEGFRCTAKDMVQSEAGSGDRAARMEVEANVFAAELLFPRPLFLADLRRRAGLDLDHVLQLASRYDMSKEATARRYVGLQDEPCAVVFSHNGVIRYIRKSKDFPFIEAGPGQRVPAASLAARHCSPQGIVSDWDEVDAGVWLAQPKGRVACEQTLAQSNGYGITLLSLADDELADDLDEEEELVESWRPHFPR